MIQPGYDLRPCDMSVVADLCARFHAYKSTGVVGVYAFAVFEDGVPVAAFAWQPPPPQSAKSVCPEAPAGVLSLSRMVAVPREERRLNHISKPLRRQMRQLIDRTRWPVLVTYSDVGQGHTGHVYKCSGWEPTALRQQPFFLNEKGERCSAYNNGKLGKMVRAGTTQIQRWEHWACRRGEALLFMTNNGWKQVPTGKVWRSGRPAHRWVKEER